MCRVYTDKSLEAFNDPKLIELNMKRRDHVLSATKSVRFGDTIEVYSVPNSEMLQDVKESLWYQELPPAAKETISDHSFEERRRSVEEVLNAVLDEQIEQWSNGVYDPQRIAEVSSSLSELDRFEALQHATAVVSVGV